MKRVLLCLLVGVAVISPVVILARTPPVVGQSGTLLDNPVKRAFSLLDPHRFKISHAYSFSYISGNGYSGAVGTYFSTIQYQLAKPLTLRVGLALTHNPLSALGQHSGGIVTEGLYPSFQLDYRPSPNVYLGIGFERVPAYAYPASWGRRPADWWRTH